MTGPASPAKMAINALNSGAKVWLADLEDASCPSWPNVIDAILNLRDARPGHALLQPAEGKEYPLRTDAPLAVVVARPRGWHLPEAHVIVDGSRRGRRPGRLRSALLPPRPAADRQRPGSVLLPAQDGEPSRGAAVERRLHLRRSRAGDPARHRPRHRADRDHPGRVRDGGDPLRAARSRVGLNAGRWDYLFSIIKYFRDAGPEFVLVDRADITMTAPFMRAYTELLVKTCHKRGAFAMGGMAAFIPSRKDAEINKAAFAKVNADKTREAGDGFDGSWVAHPDLVPVCREVFDGVLGDKPNQIDRQRRERSRSTPAELLDVSSATGGNTEQGLRGNLEVAVAYTAVWLSGNGAVGIHNLMEDAATAEISRSQVWQQIKNEVVLADTGETVTRSWSPGSSTRRSQGSASRCRRAVREVLRPAKQLIADLCLRRLHRLPDPARVRAGQVSVLTAVRCGPA